MVMSDSPEGESVGFAGIEREAIILRLRRYWRWARGAGQFHVEGEFAIDPADVVAGGKALLPEAVQILLWNERRYPKLGKWLPVVRAMREVEPLPPILVAKTRRGWVAINGNHRVLAARLFGRSSIDATVLLPRWDPGSIVQEAQAIFRDENGEWPLPNTPKDLPGRGTNESFHPTGFSAGVAGSICGDCTKATAFQGDAWVCSEASVTCEALPWIQPSWLGCSRFAQHSDSSS